MVSSKCMHFNEKDTLSSQQPIANGVKKFGDTLPLRGPHRRTGFETAAFWENHVWRSHRRLNEKSGLGCRPTPFGQIVKTIDSALRYPVVPPTERPGG